MDGEEEERGMERIVKAEEMRAADQYTSDTIGIPEAVLIARAALALADEVKKRISAGGRVLILLGSGNNGADGAALARILNEEGYEVYVSFLGKTPREGTPLFAELNILSRLSIPIGQAVPLEAADVIVDCLFGTGLSRPITGEIADCIRRVNTSGKPVLSADLPSGIHTDSGEILGAAIHAEKTVTFAWKKTGLLLHAGRRYAGEVILKKVGIVLPEKIQNPASIFSIEAGDAELLKKRDPEGNKGTFGKALIIAGSKEMVGAAFLSARAALASGCGMVHILTEETNRSALYSLLPEALFSFYKDRGSFTEEEKLEKALSWCDCVLIGPGLGRSSGSRELLHTFLKRNRHYQRPAVLDADALNLLSDSVIPWQRPEYPCVFTPHLMEMSRLTKMERSLIQKDPLEIAAAFAKRWGIICVLKDACTITADELGDEWINTSGSSALSTAGSGDVLAGLTAGILARFLQMNENGNELEKNLPALLKERVSWLAKEEPENAGTIKDRVYTAYLAALAVFLHGLLGERAARHYSENTVLARNLIEMLPELI